MNIHEYQAKQIFARYRIPIPQETLCASVGDVTAAFLRLNRPVAVKAQVHAGGRGKAGGVIIARTLAEAENAARQMFGMRLNGLPVNAVLIAEAADIAREFYVGVTTDRASKHLALMASAAGGVEIETLAQIAPEKIVTVKINPETGLRDFQSRNLASRLFADMGKVSQAAAIFAQLYRCYVENDAALAEINPLAETTDGRLLALDAKMSFDDNALFRHPDIAALRDETDAEFTASGSGLNYVKLDGDIGCMANGAGLAMATMDEIALCGGRPANFLDIGGSSSPQKTADALALLLRDSRVKVALINIFGGITRCDDVANGLLTAMNQAERAAPVVARLTGTNEREGRVLLRGCPRVVVADSMREAAQQAVALRTQMSQRAQ